ncbi:thioesterase II family protein [Micromonospora sp. KLBMP9576]|uniref:thioesterase II family protein n=1 Tax=Micromonospora sp. KLBMP9576 TaxID=3424769 RepID=UPI003D946424
MSPSTPAAPPTRRPTMVHPLGRSDAARSLVCLPFCGGGTGSYRGWAQAVDDDTDLALVCYPGREARFTEPFARTWDELAADATECVLLAADRPYTLFGHSMGGWMAFDVATRIERTGGPTPDVVVVSACNAPFRGVTERDRFPRREDSDGRLLDWMRQAGALPDYASVDPELSSIAVDLMRADVRIRDSYSPDPGRRTRLPVQVLHGVDDPIVDPRVADEWAVAAAGPLRVDALPGGHFYDPSTWSGLPRRFARSGPLPTSTPIESR